MRNDDTGVCPRCHGMMVETYSDVASPTHAGGDVIGLRCVNCGEYVDRLVLLNRWAQQGVPPLPLQLVGERLRLRTSATRGGIIDHRLNVPA